MANPAFWGLFAAGLEILIGALLLVGGSASKLGWVAVAAFQVALILLGLGLPLLDSPRAGHRAARRTPRLAASRTARDFLNSSRMAGPSS